ncbi:MAG TPA: hypothetical protein DIT48_09455 [Actinobacteria bacterium]|nr:hypothetical protein [Actinomycetota bacterium]HCP62125.1 hypothetical protein [Actinomycetota bacterium]
MKGWFAGRIPEGWFTGTPDVTMDREEILIVGTLADVTVEGEATEAAIAAARSGRIKQHREDTREARMRIANEAEHRFGRKVSWGATIGEATELFTTVNMPVMTRLRMTDRQVLDTLVDAGVARSRSEALAWCVRLVGSKQSEWITELRDALGAVEKARAAGPQSA